MSIVESKCYKYGLGKPTVQSNMQVFLAFAYDTSAIAGQTARIISVLSRFVSANVPGRTVLVAKARGWAVSFAAAASHPRLRFAKQHLKVHYRLYV